MSRYTILSSSVAIATLWAAGTATAQTKSPFKDKAFVGRDDMGDKVTALFAELTAQAEAPAQIDVIIFYDSAGSVLATLTNVPVRVLSPSRWVYAATRNRLPPPVEQNGILIATRVTFVVKGTLAQASLAMTWHWTRYLPDRVVSGRRTAGTPTQNIGTGSCPNCVQSYLCHCAPTLYDIPANDSLCPSPDRSRSGSSKEACKEL